MAPNVVAFRIRYHREHRGASEVVPIIDGHELTDLVHAFERERGMETRAISYG